MLKSILDWLAEAWFPRRCLGCGGFESYCCMTCLMKFSFTRILHCPSCGHASPLGEFCTDCQPTHQLNGLWVAQPYGHPLIRTMIRELKFNGLTELAPRLVDLLTATLRAFNLPPAWHAVPKEGWHLTPVPLTPRRERYRNFNQSELLAQGVAEATALPLAPILRRTRTTPPQSEIKNTARRQQNVQGIFALAPGAQVAGRAYILVDDVYTSGATLEECARVLKASGALEVWGLTVAHG